MAPVAFCALVLLGVVGPAVSDQHSLYYIYTALSKDVALPGIYEFTALGLLNDREIDYYNSKEQVKVPKQDWMKEKMQPDYWEKGTQSRKSKEQWFKVNVGILMDRMRHNQTDLHVLQWRHGCEIEEADGSHRFLRGIDEYSYDGSEFLSFDDDNMRWIAPVPEALPTKRKWDDVPILNQYTKGYLEKECVDWLTKFMEYGKESLRKHSKPDVYAFSKKSTINSGKLTLTCLATGFYPKDVKLCVRKFRTSLPEHLLTSSGVRPNDDGTYQLRKSVDIEEDDTADYDCYVNHITLAEPVITKWEGPPSQGGLGLAIGGVVGVIVLAVLVGVVIFIVMRKAGPKNLRIVETTPKSFEVQWKKPLGKIDRYIISASPSETSGSVLSQELEVPSGKNSALIDHLEPGCLYDISVFAERGTSRSRPATVEATTMISEPTNLKVVKTTPTSVMIKWEKAKGKIDRYIVRVSPSQTNGLNQIEVSSKEDCIEIDHLESGCSYSISVVAEKGNTQSEPATVLATPAGGSDTDSGRGSNKSSTENVSANSDASSDSGSRSSGSPHGSVDNVDETTSLMEGTPNDPNREANDQPADEEQALLSVQTPSG
ncbi:class I histocompatibility antigen, F10 alpha chain-like [Colossoma macropomum]|uniref:class I histocompatibility antigen, F10 alpha chain-like n=1 Tax=Colossoma macropomum TaxID=42526 RepID=UPI001864C021|nr:class I histocompatibility antigen, F10 alpha chain-like [Colossoma macropomum]